MAESRERAVETMSVMEFARKIGVSKSTCYALIRREDIETVMVAGKMRVVTESARAWYHRQDYFREGADRDERHAITEMRTRISRVNEVRGRNIPEEALEDEDSEVF